MSEGQVARGKWRVARVGVMLLLMAAVPGGPAAGQESADGIRAELRVAATRIADEHHTLWLRTGPGREPVETKLNTRTFSRPIKYQGPATAQFFATREAARADEPDDKPLAHARLEAGGSLLVFVPAAEGNGYRVLPIRGEAFPYGSYNFANFSQATILVQAGDKTQPVQLDPGKSRVFTFPENQRVVTLRIAGKSPREEPRLIRQTKLSITPEWREVVFFFNPPTDNRIRMCHLVDTKPAPRAE